MIRCPAKQRRVSSGRAEVQISQSWGVTPRSKSRTQPPTRYASWPWAASAWRICTAGAVRRNRAVLSRVAAERINAELCKLLEGRGAGAVLRP